MSGDKNLHLRVVGIDEINKNILQLAIGAPLAVRNGILRAAYMIQRQAVLNLTTNGYSPATKVKTGRLKSSISTNWTGSPNERGKVGAKAKASDGVGQPQKKGRKDTFSATVGTNVVYGRRVELGFVGRDSLGRRYNQAAKPYLYPAYFAHESDVGQEVAVEIGKDLKKAFINGRKKPKI